MDDLRLKRLRKNLKKKLAECEQLIVDAQYAASVRPDVAPCIAPDSLIDVYQLRDWTIKALAALDNGEQIPQPPESCWTPTTTTPRWNGWARNGTRGRWRCLVRGAASDTEAMELLRQRTSGQRHVDLTVMREGRHPGEQRPE